jgi:hypothetical protein
MEIINQYYANTTSHNGRLSYLNIDYNNHSATSYQAARLLEFFSIDNFEDHIWLVYPFANPRCICTACRPFEILSLRRNPGLRLAANLPRSDLPTSLNFRKYVSPKKLHAFLTRSCKDSTDYSQNYIRSLCQPLYHFLKVYALL